MIRSFYTAGWSMLSKGKNMDIISNNLANVSTTGYKKDTVVYQTFPEVMTKRLNDYSSQSNPTGVVGDMKLGSDITEIHTNYTQGQLQKTNNNFDLAIQGADKAFFTIGVKDNDGNLKEYYSKDGSFTIDANGFLTTKDGKSVMGQKGPIKVGNENFMVSENGDISIDGNLIDKLKIVEFESTSALKKYGDNLVEANPDEPKTKFSGNVRQGVLEMSNVNSIREMVDMINLLRSYESSQKVVQTIDELIGKTVNEVGVVR